MGLQEKTFKKVREALFFPKSLPPPIDLSRAETLRAQRGSRNQSEEVRQKEGKAMIGRGMFGRGIKLRVFLPIPLPIIPLPNLRGNV